MDSSQSCPESVNASEIIGQDQTLFIIGELGYVGHGYTVDSIRKTCIATLLAKRDVVHVWKRSAKN
ncbi:hypothetical protein M404DRAFT_994527 [Pisolithus tinctorius Marx 270]|uniref:Uncharacterized protein n=1 Tax=Pisolithus tinctorius Marx 270 TaxID=870435 RepID=A0A0C3PDL2_PISTI|nr:hypothetical protein M404DRAFT_994527 [Pisolithus tinctorius Marx 270]